MSTTRPLDRIANRRDLRLLGVVVAVECFLLVTYLAVVPERPSIPRYTLYPFVWINVGLWAALTIDVPDSSHRHQLVAAVVSGLYFVLLLYLTGLVGLEPSSALRETVSTIDVQPGSPGTERLHVVTDWVYFSFVSYRVIGFLTLSYLLYVTLLDVSGSIAGGIVGLFSCVGCTFPVVASLSAGVFSGSAVAGVVYSAQFDLSTVVFVVAVGLLYWRPGFDSWPLSRLLSS